MVAALSMLTCAILTSCERPKNTKTAKWVTMKEEGRFTASFPIHPTKTTQTKRLGAVGSEQAHMFKAETNGVAYLVGFSRVKEDTLRDFTTDEILDAARDGLLNIVEGKIERELLINHNGLTGREVWCSIPYSSSKVTMLTRIYIAGDYKYIVSVTTGIPNGVFTDDAARFFESFRINN